MERRRRAVSLVLGTITLVLIPWTLWLSIVLPARHTTHDWDATWVGFDVFLLVTLGLTVVAYRKRWTALPLVASAAGVLLYVDAWFDNALSGGATSAIVLALLAELPLGTFCLWLAWEALTATSRGDRTALVPASPRPRTRGRRRRGARSRVV
jgi:hypothetical protein